MGDFIKDFHVITMISNTQRYESRYRLYHEFAKRMEEAGVRLWTAEVAFGTRPFALTDPNEFRHLQLRTLDEIWHKERALNLLVQRITEQHPDWKYLAWIDADVEFQNKNWVSETVHALQHFHVVQLFQTAVDLGPQGQALHVHTSFAYRYVKGGMASGTDYLNGGHPGFAYAITREAYEACPFIDFAILGSGDRHMIAGWCGMIEQSVNQKISPEYMRKLLDWQAQVDRYVRRDVGYVPGSIYHYWHGKKSDRRYGSRWEILTRHQYNPDRDIKNDGYGLLRLADHGDLRSIQFRDEIRAYMHSRNEDSIDLE